MLFTLLIILFKKIQGTSVIVTVVDGSNIPNTCQYYGYNDDVLKPANFSILLNYMHENNIPNAFIKGYGNDLSGFVLYNTGEIKQFYEYFTPTHFVICFDPKGLEDLNDNLIQTKENANKKENDICRSSLIGCPSYHNNNYKCLNNNFPIKNFINYTQPAKLSCDKIQRKNKSRNKKLLGKRRNQKEKGFHGGGFRKIRNKSKL